MQGSSSTVHSALSLLQQSETLEIAVASFTQKRASDLGDAEFRVFAEAIAELQPAGKDFSKLVQLHGKVHKTYPDSALKIYRICMALSNHVSTEPAEITELYNRLTSQLRVDQIAQNQFRTLQYLDLALQVKTEGSILEAPLVRACLELGYDSEIQHDALLGKIRVSRDSNAQKTTPDKIYPFVSKIIDTLAKIPQEARSAAIKIGTKNYTKDLDSDLVRAISLLPPASREDSRVISALASILTRGKLESYMLPPGLPFDFVEKNYGNERILFSLEKIPPEDRVDVILRSILFMIGVSVTSPKGDILTEIAAIPREYRDEVLHLASIALISRNADHCSARALIIKTIYLLPTNDRTDEVIDAVLRINQRSAMSSLRTEDFFEAILNEILQESDGKENLAQTLITLAPIIEKSADMHRIYRDGFLKIPKDERKEVCSLVAPGFKTVISAASAEERISVLSIISVLPDETRLTALRDKETMDAIFAIATHRAKTDSFKSCPLAQKIAQLPKEERVDFIKLAARTMHMQCYQSPTVEDRWSILIRLAKIPRENRKSVVEKVEKLITVKMDGRTIGRYIEIFGFFGTEQRLTQKFLENLSCVLSKIADETEEDCNTGYTTAKFSGGVQLLLSTIKSLPAKNRTEGIGFFLGHPIEALKLVKLLPSNGVSLEILQSIYHILPCPAKAFLYETLKTVPQEHYPAVLLAITSNLNIVNNNIQFPMLAETIGYFPPTDIRKELIEGIISLYSGQEFRMLDSLRICFRYLHPVDRAPSIPLMLAHRQALSPQPILTFLYLHGEGHEERKARSHQHLFAKINPTVNIHEAAEVARYIVINHSMFLIASDHDPLYQRAIEVATLTDAVGASNPKNPYRIYRELKSLENTITTYTPPTEVVCGESVHFNPIASQEFAKRCAANPRFKDLPSDVHANTMELLFKGIEDHAKTLEGEVKQKFCDSLHMGLSYPILKAAFLQGDLPAKLAMTGAPDEIVPIDVALYFAIVHSILKESNERPSPEQLSPREEILLMKAAFFKSCSGGQLEAIDRTYYTHLQDEDRIYKLKEERSSGLYIAENLIHQEIQKILVPLFSEENAFTREITGTALENQVIQLPHQAIYAKNIVGMRMGLEHSLTFDQSTGSLADHILAQDIPSLLTSGYRYFLPSTAVKAIQAAVTKKYKELQAKDTLNKAAWEQDTSTEKSKKPPESLARLFYTQMNELADKIDRNHDIPLWELDEETGEISACAPEGALAFLKGSGHLQSLKRSSSASATNTEDAALHSHKKQKMSDNDGDE